MSLNDGADTASLDLSDQPVMRGQVPLMRLRDRQVGTGPWNAVLLMVGPGDS